MYVGYLFSIFWYKCILLHRPFHKTLPRSSAFVKWISSRFYAICIDYNSSVVLWNRQYYFLISAQVQSFTYKTPFVRIAKTIHLCLYKANYLFSVASSNILLRILFPHQRRVKIPKKKDIVQDASGGYVPDFPSDTHLFPPQSSMQLLSAIRMS